MKLIRYMFEVGDIDISGQRLRIRKKSWAVEDFTAQRCSVSVDDDGQRIFDPWGVEVVYTTPYEVGARQVLEMCLRWDECRMYGNAMMYVSDEVLLPRVVDKKVVLIEWGTGLKN